MKELEIKLNDLKKKKENLTEVLKYESEKIEECKKSEDYDKYDKELYHFTEYSRFKEIKKEIEKQIYILEEAINIIKENEY